MTPSERIHCIKNISKVLAEEDWPIIDLTLRQFSLPTYDSWEGNGMVSYVMEMIDNASNEDLLNLEKHLNLNPSFQPERNPTVSENIISTSFWQPSQPRIFLSHHSSIKSKTIKFKTALEKYAFAPFVAHEDIEPTREWQTEIEKALLTMDALVALLSPGFQESYWTDQKVGVAVGRGIPIVPIRIGLDPYGFIGKYQALQGQGRNIEQVALEIFNILLAKPNLAEKLSEALIEDFLKSKSYAVAKVNMDSLEKLGTITPAMSKRLEKAPEENSQIKGAFGVPERLEKLLSKA